MAKYLCMQRTTPGSPPGTPPSPDDMEKMYAEFNAWRVRFSDNLVDLGGRLGPGALVTNEATTDGPFVEAKELIGGYMIVSADDLPSAIEIARACPGVVGPNSGVWVREIHSP